MLKEIFENVRSRKPLVHNMTNYVTANDCANILLACGGSPIMAEEEEEVAEITSICSGLNLNMGTPNPRKVNAMLIAGKRANELDHPIVLDPVGVGVSEFRMQSVKNLMRELSVAVIKGNVSEIKALAEGRGSAKGVDAKGSDQVTEENLDEMVRFAKSFAKEINAVIVMTGAIDLVVSSEKAYCIRNGHPMMAFITGTGCQLSAMMAAFVSANPEKALEASMAAVCAMGFAGEIAYGRLSAYEGNATYRNYLIDAIYRMTPEQLEKGACYEVR